MTQRIPFRKDIVGSFLRPEALKEARAALEEGKISAEELRAVEDREIRRLVEEEKKNGLHDFTDGEFRRAFWHLDFLAALTGCEQVAAKAWSVHLKGSSPRLPPSALQESSISPKSSLPFPFPLPEIPGG